MDIGTWIVTHAMGYRKFASNAETIDWYPATNIELIRAWFEFTTSAFKYVVFLSP